jgi:RND superfamily putative drug exporter
VFGTLGRLVTSNPWKVVIAWVIAVAVIVPLSPTLAEVSNTDQASFLPKAKEAMRAQQLAEDAFPAAAGANGLFVVSREDGEALRADDLARVSQLAAGLKSADLPRVVDVTTSADEVAENGRVQLVDVEFEGQATDKGVHEAIAAVREAAVEALDGTALQAALTGEAAIQLDTEEAFGSAESITFLATLLLIIVLVGAIFRSPIAAFLPILTIGLVFTVATSLVALAAKTFGFEVDASLTSLLIVVLFGIGTDYILFLLFRYRERLRAGDDSRTAVAFSVRRVGEAVASSALVVIAAFLAMLLAQLGFLSAMAPGLAISVAVTLLASLTLVPAVMTLIGPRVFWPSKRWQTAPENALFKRLGQLIARRPARMAVASGLTLVALAAGTGFYTASYEFDLPSGTESGQALDTMRSAFPAGQSSPTDVYVRGGTSAEARALAGSLKAVPGVASVAEPVESEDGTVTRISATLANDPASNSALATVAGPLREVAHGSGAGEEVLVGGETALVADLRDTVNRDMSIVFPVAALIIALILGLLLRSVVAPAYLLGAVALGFAATLGAGVAIFQGIAGANGLLFMLPIMLYLFVVAIGTDYNILMTARLREEVVEGNDARTSADLAVEHAGPTVASAGLILAGTFASLGLTGIGLLVQMGTTIAIGVLLVSIVMATVLVPSLSALLGHRVWWPGHRAAPGAAVIELSRPAETEESRAAGAAASD